MRTQTGMNGETIDASPAYFLGPVAMETDADILGSFRRAADRQHVLRVKNPWAGKLEPITDPHLDAVSDAAWYLFAHPNVAPVIEVAWLEGEEQPYVEEQIDFNSDALIIKVRHDFGAGAVDHVGGYKNPGE